MWRYLLFLTLTLLNDEVYGIFAFPPPDGALPELESLETEPVTAAEWEIDTTWEETLNGLPDDFQDLECSVHKCKEECGRDHQLDDVGI